MTTLFSDIERANSEIGHGWTSPEKACAIASMIVALRPAISIEIGVWAGKGLIAMGLAHKAIGIGKAIGVDPYSAQASVEGQIHPADQKFWAEADHEAMYSICLEQIKKRKLEPFVDLRRVNSNNFTPPEGVGVLRVDANHGQQALRDIQRFAPKVRVGGLMITDDAAWTGLAVKAGIDWLLDNGWQQLYQLEDGPVLQRIR